MKQRLIEEIRKTAAVFVYLAIVLGAFATYKRLVLAEHGIATLRYGYSLLEALVLAKVVLLGDLMRLGRRFRERPLIIPVLHRTALFTLLTLALDVVERLFIGGLEGIRPRVVFARMFHDDQGVVLAQMWVMFVAFALLFAAQELDRALGEGRLFQLFFKRRQPPVL